MGGKGELVEFTRLFKEGPLSDADKAELKRKINRIIDGATFSITIEAMVQVPIQTAVDHIMHWGTQEARKRKRKTKK
jgi:CRISPR/Cas system-associated endoribonuclease Cas2